MDLNSITYLLIGSTFGLFVRIFIKDNFKFQKDFVIKNTSLINYLASLILGIFVAVASVDRNLFLFFYVGFLGSLSTFSSFIYQLYVLLITRKFVKLFLHYFEVITLSFLFFYTGFFLIKIIFMYE